MAKRNNKHTNLVKKIKNSPSIIGLENIILIAEEVEIRKEDRSGLICCPDLMMYDKTLYLYGVEIKGTTHPRTLGRLRDQTDKLYNYLDSLGIKRYSVIGAYYDGGYIKYYERRKR